ncbi:CD3324 family protein [Desnuesiella massiliensis]|uniref:CD3324 family protein n=1 Tax=Desnuesiella massiliensis TaxID=1650662 RepID=UPI0006E1F3AA|nr:CD3324 family protein [Desnuesiella massiliensis]
MKYTTASNILPKRLVEEIQRYVQGQYLYIPREPGIRSEWGERSGAREDIARRNMEIRKRYKGGESKERLAEAYCLSLASIKKIVYISNK